MPTYKVTASDGRVLKITGDTPPNEQQLNEIFSKVQGTQVKQPKESKGYQGIDYSDIQNDPNLSKEEKAQAIHERTVAENKRLDRESALKQAKMVGGWALNAASWGMPVGGGLKAATALVKAGKPVAGRVVGTILKNTPGLAASGAVGGLGQALSNDATDIKDYLKSIGLGAGIGVGFGKGMQALGKGGQALLNSEAVIKSIPKVQQLFNSVPAEYAERALRKELAGDSIFKGKFNSKDLNTAYKEAGEKAIAGMKNAESNANRGIQEALDNLPMGAIDKPKLMIDITKGIDKYAHGGRYNPALEEKGNDILKYIGELDNPGNKTVDFHNIKNTIQSELRNKYGKDSGDGINALKGMAAKIREELNNVSPEYAQANADREALHNIKFAMDGMNPKTIASKLRNVENDEAVRKGLNEAAEELNNLVAPEYKFMDDVNNLRAREALEQWFPGQYGGFGTREGFANLLRGLAVSSGGAAMAHNPAVALAFSPKISGKTAIQGLGLLNKSLKGVGKIYDKAIEKYLNAERGLLTHKNQVTASEKD